MASVQPLATEAGIRTFAAGGNAVDAAVAVALTLGVVDSHDSGLGAGCFMLIHRANGENIALDGREMAPAAATRDMFLTDGKADTQKSQLGALAIGIPGSLAVYDAAVSQYGTKSLRDLLLPAADIAEHGFPIDAHFADRDDAEHANLAKFPDATRHFPARGRLALERRRNRQTTRPRTQLPRHRQRGNRVVLPCALPAGGRALDEGERRTRHGGGFCRL